MGDAIDSPLNSESSGLPSRFMQGSSVDMGRSVKDTNRFSGVTNPLLPRSFGRISESVPIPRIDHSLVEPPPRTTPFKSRFLKKSSVSPDTSFSSSLPVPRYTNGTSSSWDLPPSTKKNGSVPYGRNSLDSGYGGTSLSSGSLSSHGGRAPVSRERYSSMIREIVPEDRALEADDFEPRSVRALTRGTSRPRDYSFKRTPGPATSPTSAQKNNNLSISIKEFMKRTEDVGKDNWKHDPKYLRATSVARDDVSNDYLLRPNLDRGTRAQSVARASSVARSFERSRDPFDFTTNHRKDRGYSLMPESSLDRDYDLSYREPLSCYSMSYQPQSSRMNTAFQPSGGHNMPSSLYLPSSQVPLKPNGGKFLTLEDECNWILNGGTSQAISYHRPGHDYPRSDDEDTLDDISGDELSEMTADLAEEHSTATLATERLEAEQAERLKLEKEKNDLTSRNKQLLHSNERMEMEVLYSRALDMNGSADSDEDGEPSIFKQKYERAIKELEFTKKRLAQQHDDDMEQLMALKKQLEKKLHDAFDEVDEQRQNVAQWKRKAQKAQGEMNDTKLLLEEQTSRNLLLEKKQRKFDAEINSLQEDRKQEKTAKDKFYRELDDIKRIKYSLEDEITAMKLDLDYKDEKISALSKELEDLHSGGTTDEEVSSLKRQKNDLEKRLKEQEEELDDMAGQVQMLEQAKIKLEMSMAALKKDHRREISSKEDELEDARNAAMKKVKALEQQLESEHEERIGFVREKHELETKIINLQDLASRSTDEDVVAKLKKDLKRTKALLKDAQYMLERSRNETSNKSLIRQLKNQLEDAEFARISAIKAKQNTDLELSDVQQQLDDVMRSKSDVEDKLFRIGREKADLATQLEDNDSELSEVMKKYKASVGQLSVDQITIHEQANAISDLEEERNQLKEQLAEFTAKVQSMEGENVSTAQHHRLELKIKELESKLDLEQTTRGRMETQINRLKEAIEKINIECDQLRGKEHSAQELVRKLQRQLRDLKEEFTNLQAKETEVNSKKNELEKMLELAEAETVTAKNDLKLAMKRIEDLQTAMNGEIDSDSDSILSDGDSDSSDDDVSNIFDRRASHLTRGSISRTLEPMPEEPESQLHEGKSRPACHDSDSDADPSSGKPSQALLDETDRTGESQA